MLQYLKSCKRCNTRYLGATRVREELEVDTPYCTARYVATECGTHGSPENTVLAAVRS